MNIEINPEFGQALELMEKGSGNLFITGKAGTGKSTLLQYFRDQRESKPVVLAPTGVAALNVGGETLHRFFGFRIDVTPEKVRNSRTKPRKPEFYKNLKMIIVDETSMLRADLLDCVDAFLRKHGPSQQRPFGGVRMIFIGDLYQLPPVVTNPEREIFRTLYESPYFFSAKALQGQELERVELQKIYRQRDASFIELLGRIRNDSVSEEDMERLNSRVDPAFEPDDKEFWITLTTTNRGADRINDIKLAALSGKTQTSHAQIEGDFDAQHFPTATELGFKKGAQLMLLNNDAAGRWVNGTIGSIEALEKDEDGLWFPVVRLRDSDNLVEVERYTWELVRFALQDGQIATETVGRFRQLPFRLAWAVTIHKSQGKTFERVVIDMERGAFAHGQTYVALSRCTSFEGMVFKCPIKASSIRCDWRIQKFLTAYHYRRSEEAMPLDQKFAVIEAAIDSGSEISMTYLKGDDTRSERVVIPLSVGLESYSGKEFDGLRAFCLLRRSERMFRVDRILEIEVLSD